MARAGAAARQGDLLDAAIEEIGRAGAEGVTVARIAARAGMSPALAHHYFGSKERIVLAAMARVLARFGAGVRAALAEADGPRGRAEAIVRASFAPENFEPGTIRAWLAFYALAPASPGARRLLRVYRRRLHSNLTHALRPLIGAEAPEVARLLAATIDGLYLREALQEEGGPAAAEATVLALLARALPAP